MTAEIINTVEISFHDFDGLNIKSIKNLSESSGQKIKDAMTFKDEERVETVGGINFNFDTEQKMYICYRGRFDSIDGAYDLKWIDMDDLLKLESEWNRRR